MSWGAGPVSVDGSSMASKWWGRCLDGEVVAIGVAANAGSFPVTIGLRVTRASSARLHRIDRHHHHHHHHHIIITTTTAANLMVGGPGGGFSGTPFGPPGG